MGDQKDHMTIQKKDVENASPEVETQDFEMATAALDPPTLQLKSEKSAEKEEGGDTEKESGSAFQFSIASPPDKPEDQGSRIFGTDTIQGKGIAEPFKIPIIQRKEIESNDTRDLKNQAFKL